MIGYEPVSVSRNGFMFCRWSVTVMAWAGVIWRVPWLIVVSAVIMAASAILTVRRAPMISLWTWVVEHGSPHRTEVLDAGGMRFAHIVATMALGIPWAVLQFGPLASAEAMWRILIFVAAFKTLGALGFCPASRMFTCLLQGAGGNCCSWLKGRKEA